MVLESELQKRPHTAVVYIDTRTLGSTSQFSDPTISLSVRCTALFRDILAEVYNGLLTFIVDGAPENANKALGELDGLGVAATEPYSSVQPETIQKKQSSKGSSKNSVEAKFSPTSVAVGASVGAETSTEAETATSFKVEHTDKIVFPSRQLGNKGDQLDICGKTLPCLSTSGHLYRWTFSHT